MINKQLSIPGFIVNNATKNQVIEIQFISTDGKFETSLKRSLLYFNSDKSININAEKIKSIVYNHINFPSKPFESEHELEKFINSHYPSYSPQEKIELILKDLSKSSSYDGETLDIKIKDITDNELWRKYYLKNHLEYLFYIENLQYQELINYVQTKDTLMGVRITLKGLTALFQLNSQENSRHCFVAMSFDESDRYIFDDAIQPALIETKFIPFIVSDRHIKSEQTINDEIIAGIKNSKFTIADFTKHKSGVYFEAGYALGRGQKVIYTCHKDDIKNAHFDTRNFQHIIWEKADDLKKKLIDKINAFIID